MALCPICDKKLGFLRPKALVDGKYRQVCGSDCVKKVRLAEKERSKVEEEQSKAEEEQFKQEVSSMIVVTSDYIPTMQVVSSLGLVRGSTVRAKHVGRDIGAGLKNIVGGEIVGYTEMMAEAREEALYRMKKDAMRLGANGVTAFRFASATIDAGAAEVIAYGTAVTVEKEGV